ncbi:hypothetical protein D9M71_550450 [compost metagenome]
MTWAKREASTTTKHSHTANFGKKVDGCPRCLELSQGAAPTAWNIRSKKAEEAKRLASIKNHDCKTSRCGVVCTAFEW